MIIYVLYFILIILANTIGAMSGMGGGVIIKPVFDFLGFHTLAQVSFYSSVAVLTMSVSSTYKQIKNGITISWPEVLSVSVGSLIGGLLGSKLFVFLLAFFEGDKEVQLIQIGLTISSLILVLVYTLTKQQSLNFTSSGAYFSIGLFLGGFSTLLGIGGGPINVSLLIVCFGLSMREATIYSIITIFFSQVAKLGEIALTTGFSQFDLSFLYVIIPAALLGGYLGGLVSGRITNEKLTKTFISVIILVILINAFNAYRIWLT